MYVERGWIKMDVTTRNLHDQCVKLMYHHVVLTMNDGSQHDGIIEAVDRDNMTVLVGEDLPEGEVNGLATRQYGGFGDYDDYGYGYGRPRRRFRRFRRRRFPLPYLTAIALLPYVLPTPYPYYPYY